jgi:hypothetical protein
MTPIVAMLVWLAGAAAAFTFLDPIVAAFLAIVGITGVGMVILVSGWVRESSFEEREMARARRRQAKWDAGEQARERDRARWEAHQARKAAEDDR